MRTTRRGGHLPAKLDGFTELHLLVGCCFCGCKACYGPAGIAKSGGKEGYAMNENARELWRRHRNALLLVWLDPDAMPTGGGFSAKGQAGCGRWFPCFAEVVFDGAAWPRKSAKWPPVVKHIYDHVSDQLKR